MNYPFGAAITLFVGAGRLDRRVLDSTTRSAPRCATRTARPSPARLERALTVYPPTVTAVQLNLLDSHDTPRFLSMVSGDRPRCGWRPSSR